MPKRLQRKRMAGWRCPRGAVYVGRPTLWGNPFKAGHTDTLGYLSKEAAVALYRTWLETSQAGEARLEFIDELRGKDLVCWCGPDECCHADVLLELANRPAEKIPVAETPT